MLHLSKIVVPRIGAKWEDVAYALGYDIPIVEYIKHNHDDPRECCKELLKNWLITNNGTKPKIWSTLLQKVGEVDELVAARGEIIEELEAAETSQSCAVLSAAETPQSSTNLSGSPLIFSLSKWLPIHLHYALLFAILHI